MAAPLRTGFPESFCNSDLNRHASTTPACTPAGFSVENLVLPRFSAAGLESRSHRCRHPTSPGNLIHLFSLPFSTAGYFSLPQSLFWAPDREQSLPEKELNQPGYPTRPQKHRHPLPARSLTANSSQGFADFPLQGEPGVALNPGK